MDWPGNITIYTTHRAGLEDSNLSEKNGIRTFDDNGLWENHEVKNIDVVLMIATSLRWCERDRKNHADPPNPYFCWSSAH